MKDLMIKEYNGVNVTDSREVATMVGKRHTDLLRSIDNYNTILLNAKLRSHDFFEENIDYVRVHHDGESNSDKTKTSIYLLAFFFDKFNFEFIS